MTELQVKMQTKRIALFLERDESDELPLEKTLKLDIEGLTVPGQARGQCTMRPDEVKLNLRALFHPSAASSIASSNA